MRALLESFIIIVALMGFTGVAPLQTLGIMLVSTIRRDTSVSRHNRTVLEHLGTILRGLVSSNMVKFNAPYTSIAYLIH